MSVVLSVSSVLCSVYFVVLRWCSVYTKRCYTYTHSHTHRSSLRPSACWRWHRPIDLSSPRSSPTNSRCVRGSVCVCVMVYLIHEMHVFKSPQTYTIHQPRSYIHGPGGDGCTRGALQRHPHQVPGGGATQCGCPSARLQCSAGAGKGEER